MLLQKIDAQRSYNEPIHQRFPWPTKDLLNSPNIAFLDKKTTTFKKCLQTMFEGVILFHLDKLNFRSK